MKQFDRFLAFVFCQAVLVTWGGSAADAAAPEVYQLGGDLATGCLVEHYPTPVGTWGRTDPVPVFVIVHGFNPCPRLVRFTFPAAHADAIHHRYGGAVRVFSWDWNASTFVALRRTVNEQQAVWQGRQLASSLRRHGVCPEDLHLIGHSLGAIVVASAAREIAESRGRVQHLTLLDPLRRSHGLIFEQLGVPSAAGRVNHFWTPRPTGYGADSGRCDVTDVCVGRRSTFLGRIFPARSNHVYVVQWYLDQLRR